MLTTGVVLANRGSCTCATSDSVAEKTTSRPRGSKVSPFSTGSDSTSASGSSSHHQRRAPVFGSSSAWPSVLPAERSDAATRAIPNQGCRWSATTNC